MIKSWSDDKSSSSSSPRAAHRLVKIGSSYKVEQILWAKHVFGIMERQFSCGQLPQAMNFVTSIRHVTTFPNSSSNSNEVY